MSGIRNITLWFFLLASLYSCSEDISMVSPGAPIPVVYGILDIRDSVHQVLFGKTFSGEESLSELTYHPGMMYDPDGSVTLIDPVRQIQSPFTRITDGQRVPGLFPVTPRVYYRLVSQLRPGNYQLVFESSSTDSTLAIELNLPGPFQLISPHPESRRIYFYEDPMVFSWIPPAGSGVYEIAFILHYEDHFKNSEQISRKFRHTVLLFRETLEQDHDRLVYRFYSDLFFRDAGRSIPVNEEVGYRKPVWIDLEVTAGDTVLSKYLKWQTLAIDGQINPNGNINGAIGFIAGKYTIRMPHLKLSARAQDSLVLGRFTKLLGFVANPDW